MISEWLKARFPAIGRNGNGKGPLARLMWMDWEIEPGSRQLMYLGSVSQDVDAHGNAFIAHRVAILGMLTYVPVELRENGSLIQRTRVLLRGVYNAQGRGFVDLNPPTFSDAPGPSYELLNLVAGIFHPQRLGVVQMYGVVGSYCEPLGRRVGGHSRRENREFAKAVEEAYAARRADGPRVRKINDPARTPAVPPLPTPQNGFQWAYAIARLGYEALWAALLGAFEQSRLEPLDEVVTTWLRRALTSMRYATTIVGNPDPRETPRGLGRGHGFDGSDSTGSGPEGNFALQQSEVLMRGLAAREQDFLLAVFTRRVPPDDIAVMLQSVAQEASLWASRQRGAKAINIGLAVPVILAAANSFGTGQSHGTSEGTSQGTGIGETVGTAHTVGETHGTSHTSTTGVAYSQSQSRTEGTTVSEASTTGYAETYGVSQSHTDSTSVSDTTGGGHTTGTNWSEGTSSSHTTSSSTSYAVTDGTAHTVSHSVTDGTSHTTSSGSSWGTSTSSTSSWGTTTGTTVTDGVSSSDTMGISAGVNVGGSGSVGIASLSGGVNVGGSYAHETGTSHSVASSTSQSVGGSTTTTSTSGGFSSTADTVSHAETRGTADTTSHAETRGTSQGVADTTGTSSSRGGSESDSTSWAHSTGTGTADTTGTSYAYSASRSHSSGVARSVAETTGVSETQSRSESSTTSHAVSTSDSTSRALSRSYAEAASRAAASTVSTGQSVGFSGSIGLGPSLSLSKTYQWEDDLAQVMTSIYRLAESYLFEASREGAYLADVYCLTRTPEGLRLVETLVPQAFHGTQEVLTPVLTRKLEDPEMQEIANRVLMLSPSPQVEEVRGILQGYRHSSLLPLNQAAVYFAPGMFEEGRALTMQERIPPFAFLPDTSGDVVLANIISPETGQTTNTLCRMSIEQMANFLAAGDTGSGKTVACERLALETTEKWGFRTIVLDFGAGWRKLLSSVSIPQERKFLYSLYAGAARPLIWNPLEIGPRVDPEEQLYATVNLLANAGRMGERQIGFMREALRELYTNYGVIPEPGKGDRDWTVVQEDEVAVLGSGVSAGTPLQSLSWEDRAMLSRYRSRRVTMREWYRLLDRRMQEIPDRNQTDRTAIQGVLLRLEPLAVGKLSNMYNPPPDAPRVVVEDLAYPSGLAVIEGSASMDEYSRAALFGLLAWRLYVDAVARRRESGGQNLQPVQIFFEEANKVLTGVGRNEEGGNASSKVSEIFESMWRDSRKYRIYLHLVCQTPSEIPPGIISSCNNSLIFQLKNPRDRDLAASQLARSEKGFADEPYRRFIARMPRGTCILRLGASPDIARNEPMYVRPLMVELYEPRDHELDTLVANLATPQG